MSFQKIRQEIESGKFHPVYFFCGEESWAIDTLTDLLIEKVLTEAQRDFNQHMFYAKDTELQEVVNTARRYPVFAERQLVVLKEAQEYRKWEEMEAYLGQPVPSTVLVINYKHGKPDMRKSFGKTVKKSTCFFESTKLKEFALPGWISTYLSDRGKTIDHKSTALLIDHLGNDLSRISNELDKLIINISGEEKVTPKHIETYIGISKDYNAFELTDALAVRNYPKAMEILHYFSHNPKAGPYVFVMVVIFNFFSKLLHLHSLGRVDDREVASQTKIPAFVVKDYRKAQQFYSVARTEYIIGLIALYDARMKGIGSGNTTSPYDLLKEMTFRIMH